MAAILAVLAGLHLLPGRIPVIAALEEASLTARFQLRGPVEPGPEVVLVVIDDRTLGLHGRWPLPRELIARGVARIADADPRIVVFDLLFEGAGGTMSAEDERVLRQARQALRTGHPALAEDLHALTAGGPGDRRLAEAVAEAGNVLIPFAFTFDTAEAGFGTMPPSLARAAFPVAVARDGEQRAEAIRPAGVLAPLAPVADAAAWIGHVTVSVDADGQLRHSLPVVSYLGKHYPSLALEAARVQLGLERGEVAPVLGAGIKLGSRFVPTDRLMRLPVNHYGPTGTFETLSFADLVAGEVDPARLRDRIVVIGGAALAVGDSFATPFSQTLPGAEFHATVIDNLIHDRALVRDTTTTALDAAALVLLGFAAALLGRFAPPALGGLGAVVLLALWGAVNLAAFSYWHLWVGFVPAAAALILVFLWTAAIDALREQRRRALAERQRRNLARYFSPAVVDAIVDRDEPYGFDRAGPAAVMFVDLAGFTTFSEHIAPAEAMALLRDFHARVVRAVFGHHGTVDKFLGDGALAAFGMPEPDPAAAANAIAAARDLAAAMEKWNAERAEAGLAPLGFGIGIHYGPVLAGDLGGADRFEFTIAGDTVNVASRLEGLTRRLGVRVVASADTIDAARGVEAEPAALDGFAPLPPQAIRGRDDPLAVWVWPDPGTRSEDGDR